MNKTELLKVTIRKTLIYPVFYLLCTGYSCWNDQFIGLQVRETNHLLSKIIFQNNNVQDGWQRLTR